MANQPGTFTGTQGSTGTGHSAAVQGHSTGQTGVGDATYNLISVVYHALQGAETYKKYEEDVERTQDIELAQFFRQACEEEKRRAQQGKELLARHLQKSVGSGGKQQLQSGSSGQQSASGSRSGQQSQSGSSGPSRQQSQSGSSSAQMGSGGRSQESQQGSSSSVQYGSSPRSASLSDSNKSGRSER